LKAEGDPLESCRVELKEKNPAQGDKAESFSNVRTGGGPAHLIIQAFDDGCKKARRRAIGDVSRRGALRGAYRAFFALRNLAPVISCRKRSVRIFSFPLSGSERNVVKQGL